jgi:type IV pilus assembly protein PilP
MRQCKFIILLTTCLSVLLLFSACSNDTSNKTKHYVDSVKARSAKPIEGIPEIKKYKKFTYSAANLRNPFKRQKQDVAPIGQQPDLNRPKQPLEAFPLDSLKMVGSLTQGRRIWAIVSAPNGSVFPVGTGDYMGKHFGRIVNVTQNKIVLLESYKTGNGWEKRKTILALNKN